MQGRTVSAITIDAQDSGTVYVAAGNLWKSADGGTSWLDLSSLFPCPVGPCPRTGVWSTVVVDPRKPTTIYAARDGGVTRSTDGGETWAPLTSNIGTTFLLADPKSDDTLYAGGPGLFEIAPFGVTAITFDMAAVRIGASFTATIAGSNL